MDIHSIVTIVTFLLGLSLIGVILMQQSESGLYGQGTNINKTRRGAEKTLFNLTIVISILFILVAILNFFFV